MQELSKLIEISKDSVARLVTLEIVTAVGQTKGGAQEALDIDWDQKPKVALTKINLVQGDITTVYDPEFVTGNYQSLQQFHAEREKEGHEIVKRNLEAVEALGQLILKASGWKVPEDDG